MSLFEDLSLQRKLRRVSAFKNTSKGGEVKLLCRKLRFSGITSTIFAEVIKEQ
jgi:hypothetical protein